MEIEFLQSFFLWCLIINIGIYALTAITVLVLRDIVCKVHIKLFNLGEAEVLRSTQRTTRLTSY